ncbi:hypothetical protein K435DRAFT_809435 [Dendrothele bispora CBS 962.96]|uniref:FAD/NAD(P)-binding domain-containing protein n=1 Tax=Dendrothele bispora (strain CBS 962.96) TaxID=1314807 RepID=A0A4S8KYB2_DENBC|nr:hypothetical protein K435DRAFT_809435 [Dendrothele bispora CBS 962.96]
MSPLSLTNGNVDENSKMHSKVASWVTALLLVVKRIATINVKNFHGFPTRILGPELMDEFRDQSLGFGTCIITETISKVDLFQRPFCYWREGQEDEGPETVDTLIVATGASAKEVGIEKSGMSACAVYDGAVPVLRNKPLAVIGDGDSAAEEATWTAQNTAPASTPPSGTPSGIPQLNVKVTGELLKNLRIRNVQAGEEKDLAVNGLFYAPGHEPATVIFPHPTPDQSTRYIVTVPGTTETSVRGVFADGDGQDEG